MVRRSGLMTLLALSLVLLSLVGLIRTPTVFLPTEDQGYVVVAVQLPDASALNPDWLNGASRIGVTAGASAPEHLVTQLCTRLVELGARLVVEMPDVPEGVSFRLPSFLAVPSRPRARLLAAPTTA